MSYRIIHRTLYTYTEPVTVSHHTSRMEPRVTTVQKCEEFGLEILPRPALRKNRTDYFGNRVCFFSVQELHQRLEVVARSVVSVARATPPAPQLSPPWRSVAFCFRDPVAPEAAEPFQYCCDSPLLAAAPQLADYAREEFERETPLLEGVLNLNRRIYTDFKYDPVATTLATPLDEVFSKRRGVCQDFAHMAIACLRSLGLAARYVSGYLRTRPPEGKERLAGADASHAWFAVYCPSLGWVEFDPTNNMMVAEDHITLAYGRDFSDVSPLSGIITGGGNHEVKVSVDVAAFDSDAELRASATD